MRRAVFPVGFVLVLFLCSCAKPVLRPEGSAGTTPIADSYVSVRVGAPIAGIEQAIADKIKPISYGFRADAANFNSRGDQVEASGVFDCPTASNPGKQCDRKYDYFDYNLRDPRDRNRQVYCTPEPLDMPIGFAYFAGISRPSIKLSVPEPGRLKLEGIVESKLKVQACRSAGIDWFLWGEMGIGNNWPARMSVVITDSVEMDNVLRFTNNLDVVTKALGGNWRVVMTGSTFLLPALYANLFRSKELEMARTAETKFKEMIVAKGGPEIQKVVNGIDGPAIRRGAAEILSQPMLVGEGRDWVFYLHPQAFKVGPLSSDGTHVYFDVTVRCRPEIKKGALAPEPVPTLPWDNNIVESDSFAARLDVNVDYDYIATQLNGANVGIDVLGKKLMAVFAKEGVSRATRDRDGAHEGKIRMDFALVEKGNLNHVANVILYGMPKLTEPGGRLTLGVEGVDFKVSVEPFRWLNDAFHVYNAIPGNHKKLVAKLEDELKADISNTYAPIRNMAGSIRPVRTPVGHAEFATQSVILERGILVRDSGVTLGGVVAGRARATLDASPFH